MLESNWPMSFENLFKILPEVRQEKILWVVFSVKFLVAVTQPLGNAFNILDD